MNKTFYYKDKPHFGLDIGSSSIKVLQVEENGKHRHVRGYGAGGFDPKCLEDGAITDFKSLATSMKELFEHNIIGEINTRRVAVSIPASRTYTRVINLPNIKSKDMIQAIRTENEQYIPMPIDDLYIDYSVIKQSEQGVELLSVAAPKKIIDSYMLLVRMLGLEPVAFDTSILAAGRLFECELDFNNIPTVLIDFGAASADITIHDKTVIVTGTLTGGGEEFTNVIAQKLGITKQEAYIVKSKYGLARSKKQAEISEAIQPRLDQLVKEIRRMIRYHEERSESKAKIEQVITMGGGANMPGMSDFLTSSLRLPVRMCDPWQYRDLGKLKPPSGIERSMYATASGLALIKPKELFT